MREHRRVACPESKDQVIVQLTKAWNIIDYMANQIKELSDRLTIMIKNRDNQDEGTIPAGTGVDAPDDLDSRGNR